MDEAAVFLHCLGDIVPELALPPSEFISQSAVQKVFRSEPGFQPFAELPLFFRVGRMLYEYPRPTIGELSALLSLPISTVSRMISQLEESGLAERVPDPADGRIVRVALTGAGSGICDAANRHASRKAEAVLGCLTARERTTLLGLMKKIASHLNDEKGRPSKPERSS